MNRISLILLLLLTSQIFSTKPYVEIYRTHDNGLYGRSEERDIIIKIGESVFNRFDSVNIESPEEFITAVVIRSRVVERLESKFKERDSLQIGFINIKKEGDIYTLEDDNLFLNMSFSFLKPTEDVIDVINGFYPESSPYREIVTDHYRDNYIIQIHRAENIINPEAVEITYDEAIIMATIIGDSDQWLWGIHDGRGYLENLLFY